MKWPGIGCAGRQFPAGRVRPHGRSFTVLIPALAALLLVCLLLPHGAVAEEDEYTLPKDDPCYITLEGYKRYFGQRIDNYFLLTAYRKHAANLERWQRCCAGSEKNVAKFRLKNADEPLPKTVLDIEVPAVFAKDAPCASDIYYGKGDNWSTRHINERNRYWESQYDNITKNLHTCCVKHFNECLEGAFKQDTSEAGRQRMSAESTSCLERFSPDYVAKAAEPSVSQTGPPPPERKEEEVTRMRQAAVTCESDLARVRKEHDQCEQQAQRSLQTDKAEITRLTEANNKSTQEIQDVLAKTAPRPGSEVLVGFPSGAGSATLVFLGILVLTAGYFLGWPGRSRGARRDAGAVSAIVALGVYLVSVALLPDTRFGELLLAATAAVLVAACRALARSQLELRQSGQAPPAPPSP